MVAADTPHAGASTEPVIRTDRLTKHYGGGLHRPGHESGTIQALNAVSLEVEPGEVFGFLGPNGAGKTTMIRTLLGYLHATSGSATVLGLDVVNDSVALRRRVGYLPGGMATYGSLTGSASLDYYADLQQREPVRRAELAERLQMPESDLRRKVRDYSRGMRQKLGVIQALQHDPELAILDEPTEGLDPLMQLAFYEILEDLRDAGRTIFMSSHYLHEVERICNRVAIIRAGHLMALQHVDDLLARRKRRVTLRWRGGTPDLSEVPGIADVVVLRDRTTATLSGDVAPFVRAVASPSLVDLLIEPARLEEVFYEFYAGEDAAEGDAP
ncbi:MAG TPA: ABC transporter ATP-binding protein [Pleomorphomonadaceae bacterium]|nr:ABC transporter ATP-binding protein [Pleomorphomonadaceae bacterium]